MEAPRNLLSAANIKVRGPLIDLENAPEWLAGITSGDVTMVAAFYSTGAGDWIDFDSPIVIEETYISGEYEFTIPTVTDSAFDSADISRGIGLKITGATIQPQGFEIRHDYLLAYSGIPVAISGGDPTFSSMLTKMVDNNGGNDYNAAADSLHEKTSSSTPSAPENEVATLDTLITGTIDSGDYTDTPTINDIYWQLSPDGVNVANSYLTFQIENKKVWNVIVKGRYANGGGPGTAGMAIDAWSFSKLEWQQISGSGDSLPVGTSPLDDASKEYGLLSEHKSDTGEVRIAARSLRVTAGDTIYIDMVNVRAVESGLTAAEIVDLNWKVGVPLLNSAIFVDMSIGGIGSPGTNPQENGIPSNPSDNMTDAFILARAQNFKKIFIRNGSSFILEESAAGYYIYSDGSFAVNFNSQEGGASVWTGAIYQGELISSSFIPLSFSRSRVSASGATLPPFTMIDQCSFGGALTLKGAGSYSIAYGFSEVAGSGTPVIVFAAGALLGIRNYSGGWKFESMVASNVVSLEGRGQLILDNSCEAGFVKFAGSFQFTDNTNDGDGGAVTINNVARFATDNVATSDQVNTIIAKLPAGLISDLSLTDNVDTITLRSLLERVLAMATGRIRYDFPSPGFNTLFKEDNITEIITFQVTPAPGAERKRS